MSSASRSDRETPSTTRTPPAMQTPARCVTSLFAAEGSNRSVSSSCSRSGPPFRKSYEKETTILEEEEDDGGGRGGAAVRPVLATAKAALSPPLSSIQAIPGPSEDATK
ncbi:hypothetical protein M9H77_35639 [Catharanthus roseus]|uniref:Uncharacterized protein n=1 Tax=Catharanthus roseus TaxID=4058 RepID=A0ACB9ZRB2_CATRO|nr:hypothetical protein M9H77_35639 [Catharanthus roseus]